MWVKAVRGGSKVKQVCVTLSTSIEQYFNFDNAVHRRNIYLSMVCACSEHRGSEGSKDEVEAAGPIK